MLRGVVELKPLSNLPRLSLSIEAEISVRVDPVDVGESSDEAVDIMTSNHSGLSWCLGNLRWTTMIW